MHETCVRGVPSFEVDLKVSLYLSRCVHPRFITATISPAQGIRNSRPLSSSIPVSIFAVPSIFELRRLCPSRPANPTTNVSFHHRFEHHTCLFRLKLGLGRLCGAQDATTGPKAFQNSCVPEYRPSLRVAAGCTHLCYRVLRSIHLPLVVRLPLLRRSNW